MSDRLLVFAGTTEGHELARYLSEAGRLDEADFCVATEYGESTFEDIPGVHVLSGRKDEMEMEELIREGDYRLVVDATHPYAKIVTDYLKAAAASCGVEYIRLVREEEDFDQDRVIFVHDTEEACDMLNCSSKKFLLTTGAKELSVFSRVEDFSERAVARVLPSIASLEACERAGVKTKNTIGMQGPFTLAMNRATMEQFGLEILVTKSTGKAGGFSDKVKLAEEGYTVIVIGRPTTEQGASLNEVIERISAL